MTTEGLLLGFVSPPSVPPPPSVVTENTPLPPRCTHGPTALLPTPLVTLEAALVRPAVGRIVVEDDTLRLAVLPAIAHRSSSSIDCWLRRRWRAARRGGGDGGVVDEREGAALRTRRRRRRLLSTRRWDWARGGAGVRGDHDRRVSVITSPQPPGCRSNGAAACPKTGSRRLTLRVRPRWSRRRRALAAASKPLDDCMLPSLTTTDCCVGCELRRETSVRSHEEAAKNASLCAALRTFGRRGGRRGLSR